MYVCYMLFNKYSKILKILKLPLHLEYVAKLLDCEKLMSAKQAINDKLQGNVAIVNNQIKKGLLLSLSDFF